MLHLSTTVHGQMGNHQTMGTDRCMYPTPLSLSLSLSPPLFMGKWENKLNDFYGFILGSKQKDRGY
jgi:hypothetical protein